MTMTQPAVRDGRLVDNRSRRPPAAQPAVIGPGANLTSLPAPVNLSLYAGDDFAFTISVANPDGSAMDLTGYTVAAQIRATPTSSTVLGSFTCTLVTPPTGGIISCALPNTVTATLASGGAFDVQMTSGASTITTLVAGTVTVTGDVTRP